MNDASLLTADALTYRYPSGAMALNGASLTVATNETVGLVGANGAGKSTFFSAVAGLIRYEGRIVVDGLPMDGTKGAATHLRRRLGLVFQNPDDQLFMGTLGEDVAFGPRNMGLPPDEIDRRVTASLAAVGLSGKEGVHPFHLSYGQRKRGALATALAMGPPLLLLDEPTAGLDPKGRRELIELLPTLPGGKVIATHDFDLVKRLCHRAVIMADGKMVAEGAPSPLLDDEATLLAYALA